MYKTVTLIIPTYNRPFLLKEALTSAFEQEKKPDEVIVVDDGSTDETSEIVRAFPEAKYLYQKNSGVSSARNLGITHATSEWIAFLDSDDLWLPQKLRLQLETSEKYPEFLVHYTDEIWIRNGRRVNQGKRHKKYGGWIFEKCLPLCIISPSSVMIHKKIFQTVGLFDETLPACEDYDLWLRIALRYPIHFISEPLIVKRGGHDDQLSKKFFGMDRFRVQALEKILNAPDLSPLTRERIQEEIKKKSHVYAQGCLKRHRTQEYLEYQLKTSENAYD